MNPSTKPTIPLDELWSKIQFVLWCYPNECKDRYIHALQVHETQIDGANWHALIKHRSDDDNIDRAFFARVNPEIVLLRQGYDALSSPVTLKQPPENKQWVIGV